MKPVAQATTLEEAHTALERILPQEVLDKVDVCNAENELIDQLPFLSGTSPAPVLELQGPFVGGGGGFDYDAALLKAAELPEINRIWGEAEPPESPIVRHLRELGFTNTFDIRAVILDTFWCRRHGKDFRIQKRVDYYKNYRAEAEVPDETVVDPDDKSAVDWLRIYQGEGRPGRHIHLGRSKASGRLLAYELPVGMYAPDKALLEEALLDEMKQSGKSPDGFLLEAIPGLEGGLRSPRHKNVEHRSYRVKTPTPVSKDE